MYLLRKVAEVLLCHRDKRECVTVQCMAWSFVNGKRWQETTHKVKMRDMDGDPNEYNPCKDGWELKSRKIEGDNILAVCEIENLGFCMDLK